MELSFLLKGMGIGFSIAAPVGPIGVLCIRRSLADGRWIGFVTGLGAASADAAYGYIAAFGLTAISNFLTGQQFWLALLGGGFLCYLGVRTFISKPAERVAQAQGISALAAYGSTVLLTLANPATILSFIAIFAGFGLAAARDYSAASAMVIGVFLGSAAWWLLLSNAAGMVRSRLDANWMRGINRLSGVILFAFGAYALAVLSRR